MARDTAIAARILQLEESATLAVDARARALRAAGEKVIGFGAGEPDFPTPEHIVEAAVRACHDPAHHHYSPTPGLPALREAIAAKTVKDSGVAASADMVVVTNGGKQAVYSVFQALLDPGDEVLLPAPYWVTYPEAARLAGGMPVAIPTDESTGFRVTVDQLEGATTDATKLLVFVSPSNPTGAVHSPEDVAAIGRWAVERGIWVMTDEIYEHLVFGDARFSSMPGQVPELAERCVIVNGVAKTYAMTGWRVGWLVGPPAVAAAVSSLQSHLSSNVSNVAQAAALAALTGPQDCIEQMRSAFERRRRLMLDGLATLASVTCAEPEGAFYTFPNLTGLLGRELGGHPMTTTMDLAAALLDVAKVAFVPGEGFGAPGYGRLSYATSDENITEGIERIAAALA